MLKIIPKIETFNEPMFAYIVHLLLSASFTTKNLSLLFSLNTTSSKRLFNFPFNNGFYAVKLNLILTLYISWLFFYWHWIIGFLPQSKIKAIFLPPSQDRLHSMAVRSSIISTPTCVFDRKTHTKCLHCF